ncbi:hypothetical protein IDH44_02780 [Paenibacillus sp. IB182496]|uniref:Uncharacterized protein n=1 Tax=Paenibacillus sabuli TaxID=2772509 RepID=A0A927BR99_9BACL|nr:hypothetical protein [Paenibacillus sabuli]MBD2844099.1 hypothetical protein [Paenibacillus sabuli]
MQTARILGKRLIVLPFPLITIRLSRLWVSLVTGAPKATVYPLIESLAHPVVARPGHQDELGRGVRGFDEAARDALEREKEERAAQEREGQERAEQGDDEHER